jgi:hypothetical protein
MSGMGASGSFIPYAGNFGGFVPSRMGGGVSLSFSARESATMGFPIGRATLFPMSSAMTPMPGSIGGRIGTGGRAPSAFGMQGGMGLGGGTRQQMPGAGRVIPPSFGYPFYQPPSLLSSPPSSTGMSM